jgi:hypothetical protein
MHELLVELNGTGTNLTQTLTKNKSFRKRPEEDETREYTCIFKIEKRKQQKGFLQKRKGTKMVQV